MAADRGLFRRISRWTRAAVLLERAGPSAFERMREATERRRFLKQLGGAALLVGASQVGVGCRSTKPHASDEDQGGGRVVVLGAGLAGLTATHELAKAGVKAEVYEASERLGGRVKTARFNGLASPVELGGEFVDSIHEELLALIDELGLTLHDTAPDGAEPLDQVYFVKGQRMSEEELIAELVPLARAMLEAQAGMDERGEGISYATPSRAERFDQMSLTDFIAEAGTGERARLVLNAAYLNEYGIELDRMPALNIITLFDQDNLAETAAGEGWDVYGFSDERYNVREGNHQIIERLERRYRDRIQRGFELEAMKETASGRIAMTFANGKEVVADRVICTIPFSILRRLDLSGLELSVRKRKSIMELGYGMNTKLCMPLSARPWLERGDDGLVYSDRAFQSMWDPHLRRAETRGVLTNFLGGAPAVTIDRLSVKAQTTEVLGMLGEVWPGIGALSQPGSVRQQWPKDPYVRASYSGYLIGQWTTIGGMEAEPHGNLHFAGEHASSDWQGYMNGAVESGIRAAREVLGREDARAPRAARRGKAA